MVRKIRFKQVLRERIGNTGGLYRSQVRLQQTFWKEDNAHAWTIPQVRKIHSGIGTWDKLTRWSSIFCNDGLVYNFLDISRGGTKYTTISPKANYKPIKKLSSLFINNVKVAECKNTEKELQELRWKEQEQRTLEFFESQGV